VNVAVEQSTRYPWDGAVRIGIALDRSCEFDVRLRIPAWCAAHTIAVNGVPVHAHLDKGYAVLRRTWIAGDAIDLNLAMPVERFEANPRTAADHGHVALQRGPVVYCVEAVDNPAGMTNLVLPKESQLETKFEPNLLGGVVVVEADALAVAADGWDASLYQSTTSLRRTAARLRAVPYCVWDNREPGEMAVWISKA
jgi:DUF1680 family protein